MIKRMHCHDELVNALSAECDIGVLWRMFLDRYSVSKHLLVLVSIPVGLNARTIGEIGAGRSTVALTLAASILDAKLICCDRYDYRDVLKFSELHRFIVGDADKFYSRVASVDFMFIDYLSNKNLSPKDCYREIKRAYGLLPQNGILAMHDAFEKKYNVAAALRMFRKKFDKRAEVIVLPYNYGLGLIRKVEPSKHGVLKDTWQKKSG